MYIAIGVRWEWPRIRSRTHDVARTISHTRGNSSGKGMRCSRCEPIRGGRRLPRPEAIERAPVPLGGPPGLEARVGQSAQLGRESLARGAARLGLFVELPGVGALAATLAERTDHQMGLERRPPDPKRVAHLKRPGAFGALAVDIDLAARDGVRGECPGLEETRCPEPLVEANSSGVGRVSHLQSGH